MNGRLAKVVISAVVFWRFGAAAQSTPPQSKTANYVGSLACRTCHPQIYDRWKKTRMANVVRDPKIDPAAILPDLSQPNPLVTFTKSDIAFVHGSRWKQRYFKKIGDDYFVLPAQWDILHQKWLPYFVKNGTDWWAPLYPPDNFKRPQDRYATAVIPSITTSRRRPLRNGMWVANDATVQGAGTLRAPPRPILLTLPGSITSGLTIPAYNAIRRGSL